MIAKSVAAFLLMIVFCLPGLAVSSQVEQVIKNLIIKKKYPNALI